MRTWIKLAVAAAVCAAAVCGRLWYPGGAEAAGRWLMGGGDNRVVRAFAALDSAMSGGAGEAVQVFQVTRHGPS